MRSSGPQPRRRPPPFAGRFPRLAPADPMLRHDGGSPAAPRRGAPPVAAAAGRRPPALGPFGGCGGVGLRLIDGLSARRHRRGRSRAAG